MSHIQEWIGLKTDLILTRHLSWLIRRKPLSGRHLSWKPSVKRIIFKFWNEYIFGCKEVASSSELSLECKTFLKCWHYFTPILLRINPYDQIFGSLHSIWPGSALWCQHHCMIKTSSCNNTWSAVTITWYIELVLLTPSARVLTIFKYFILVDRADRSWLMPQNP